MAGQSYPACEQCKHSLSYAEMVVAFVFFFFAEALLKEDIEYGPYVYC